MYLVSSKSKEEKSKEEKALLREMTHYDWRLRRVRAKGLK